LSERFSGNLGFSREYMLYVPDDVLILQRFTLKLGRV
jgi:hypothetical protein